MMTKEAEYFITPLTLSRLSSRPVYVEMFENPRTGSEVEHISLAESADIVLIAPATANIIGKISHGIADDLLSCLVMATKAPVLIAPAMNDNMFKNSIVQENIKKLKDNGKFFVGPVKGSLACGKEGEGHLAKIEDIVKETVRLVK